MDLVITIGIDEEIVDPTLEDPLDVALECLREDNHYTDRFSIDSIEAQWGLT